MPSEDIPCKGRSTGPGGRWPLPVAFCAPFRGSLEMRSPALHSQPGREAPGQLCGAGPASPRGHSVQLAVPEPRLQRVGAVVDLPNPAGPALDARPAVPTGGADVGGTAAATSLPPPPPTSEDQRVDLICLRPHFHFPASPGERSRKDPTSRSLSPRLSLPELACPSFLGPLSTPISRLELPALLAYLPRLSELSSPKAHLSHLLQEAF